MDERSCRAAARRAGGAAGSDAAVGAAGAARPGRAALAAGAGLDERGVRRGPTSTGTSWPTSTPWSGCWAPSGPPSANIWAACRAGSTGHAVRIDGWVPARDMKQLQLAVAGSCDSVPRLVGTWHTHPYRADLQNLPIKERRLSAQDLKTLRRIAARRHPGHVGPRTGGRGRARAGRAHRPSGPASAILSGLALARGCCRSPGR